MRGEWRRHRACELFDRLPVAQRYDQWSVLPSGRVPVLDQSPAGVFGYHNDAPGIFASEDAPIVTFSNHRCYVRLMTRPFSVIQNVFPLRAKPGVDPRFLFHALRRSVPVTEYKGHWDDFARMEVWCPPLPEQRAIANILDTLDDKIELNRRMNETLEELARTLFKSWFEDFDPVKAKEEGRQPVGMDAETASLFPSRFVESELGRIPEGWEVTSLGALAVVNGGTQLERTRYSPSGRYQVFGANGVMGHCDECTHQGFVIAFGRVGAYCGSIHWAQEGAWINNNASAVSPRQKDDAAYLLGICLNVDWDAYRKGSAQPFISNSSVQAVRCVCAGSQIGRQFNIICGPLRIRQDALANESRTLAELRDLLLPKLMSGELRECLFVLRTHVVLPSFTGLPQPLAPKLRRCPYDIAGD